MSSDTLFRLVNAEFDFEFMGQTHRLRKANLDKAAQYQLKSRELSEKKDPTIDLSLVAYAIYIVLKDKVPEITEAVVRDNTPGDIDVLEVLATLGFISPDKMQRAKLIQEAVVKKATS